MAMAVKDQTRPIISASLNDAQLVMRAQKRDEDAFSLLAERYRSRVREGHHYPQG